MATKRAQSCQMKFPIVEREAKKKECRGGWLKACKTSRSSASSIRKDRSERSSTRS